VIYVAIVTSDFRFVYLINENLTDVKNVKIKHILPNELEKLDKDIDVIITTVAERNKIKSKDVFVPKSFNKTYLYSNILAKKDTRKEFDTIVIGIDPGKNIGLAALIKEEGVILQTGTFSSALEVVKEVISIFFNVNAKNFRINIGSSGDKVKEEIENRLNKIFQNKIEIKTVNEKYTTKISKKTNYKNYNKHIIAAILIAEK